MSAGRGGSPSRPPDAARGPARWPHLRALLDGYLHQDFVVEHGDAGQAVQAWLSDASRDEVISASSEWRSFLNVTSGMDVAARARALRDLVGGAWDPDGREEFDAVSSRLLDAHRR